MMLITGGRLGDIVGRRRMLRMGFALFTFASMVYAIAPNPGVLIAARVVQGLGSAAMWPQVLSIIQVEFSPTPPNDREPSRSKESSRAWRRSPARSWAAA